MQFEKADIEIEVKEKRSLLLVCEEWEQPTKKGSDTGHPLQEIAPNHNQSSNIARYGKL